MSKITAQTCRNLRRDVQVALDKVFAEYGLEGQVRNMKYSQDGITIQKIETRVKRDLSVTKAENPQDARKREFARMCGRYGLKASDFGTKFNSAGDTFILMGFKPRNTRYPILATKAGTTQMYKFPVSAIAMLKDVA